MIKRLANDSITETTVTAATITTNELTIAVAMISPD
jgi:hypothetical protein